MRDVTIEELREHMEYLRVHAPTQDFDVAKVKMVGDVAIEYGLLSAGLEKLLKDAKDQVMEPCFESFMTSVFASAFQMGREFESLLLVKDLKSSGLPNRLP